MSDTLAIIRGTHFGMRDCSYPVIFFDALTSECTGALQIISGDEIEAFIRNAGCYKLEDLEGKPCWVDTSQPGMTVFARHWGKREDA